MAEDNGEPWHRILVDDEYSERIGDLKRDMVPPSATVRTLVESVGEWANGNHRLPRTKTFYESMMSLPTSVNAKRAKQISEALAYDPYRPRPGSDEWDPDNRKKPGDEDEPKQLGLPKGEA